MAMMKALVDRERRKIKLYRKATSQLGAAQEQVHRAIENLREIVTRHPGETPGFREPKMDELESLTKVLEKLSDDLTDIQVDLDVEYPSLGK
jgi:hypothetical protein